MKNFWCQNFWYQNFWYQIFCMATIFCCTVLSANAAQSTVTWKQALRQPADWYKSDDAIRIADNVLLYQHKNGGWDKNIDMAQSISETKRSKLLADQDKDGTTIDNGATHAQLTYLARVYSATTPGQERFKEAFLKGIDYLLAAQYPNGGWPQYYPLRKGYYTHITFNDDAMIGVMTLLRDVASNSTGHYAFVDEARKTKAKLAVEKGIECILKCQVVVDGKPTVWCAQHDERSLAPAPARAYELVSLSGAESVGVVRFLMSIKTPKPEVVRAIEGAVAWFNASKLTGIKVVEKEDKLAPKGHDRVVVADPTAPPMWARFYDIQTNKPIFSDRDGIPKSTLAEIGYERRNGYRWLGNWAESLLEREYPIWKSTQTK